MAAEVPATGSTLMAAHKYIGTKCAEQSKAFMACKAANQNPEACLSKAAAVTGCVVDLLKGLNGRCGVQLDKYAACLDWNGNALDACRKEQEALHKACPL